MPAATGEVFATYAVTFTHPSFVGQREKRMDVDLIRGYSTFASIPRIIATRHGIEEGRVEILAVTRIA